MKLERWRSGRRSWLGPLALFLAVLLWTPEQLWSSRRVLFWACLAVAFLVLVLCGWCLYRVRRLLVGVVRTIYLRAAFRATQGCCGCLIDADFRR